MLSFAILLLILIIIPSVLGYLLHVHKLFPIFFLQLGLGVLIANASLDGHHSIAESLNFSVWRNSFEHLGWFGIACIIALSSAQASEYHHHQTERRFILLSIFGFSCTLILNALFAVLIGHNFPNLLGNMHSLKWFALSMGLSLSVTAVPVLVAILNDLKLNPLVKNTAISTALLDDLWLWLGIGLVLSLSNQSGQPAHILFGLTVYLLLMFLVIKPLIARIVTTGSLNSAHQLLLVLLIILLSSVSTELIGLHSVFGIFIAGIVMPTSLLNHVRPALSDICNVVFVPLFFVSSGVKISLHNLDGNFFGLLLLFSIVASSAKFISVSLLAKYLKFTWPDSLSLGILMQCKGMMELVVANVLLQMCIISQQMFAVLSIYALLSTVLTTPLLNLLNWLHQQWLKKIPNTTS